MPSLRDSIVVSISACHAEDPGSIPGRGMFASSQLMGVHAEAAAPGKHRSGVVQGAVVPGGLAKLKMACLHHEPIMSAQGQRANKQFKIGRCGAGRKNHSHRLLADSRAAAAAPTTRLARAALAPSNASGLNRIGRPLGGDARYRTPQMTHAQSWSQAWRALLRNWRVCSLCRASNRRASKH